MNEKLRQQIATVDWRNSEEIISFYEKNRLYFDNFNLIKNLDTIIEFINIKLSYIETLETKKRYKKADNYLRHVDILMQKIKNHDEFNSLYERYLFDFGIISFRLKRLEESQTYFKELVEIDKENDLYREWFEANKYRIFAKKSYIIGYVGLGLIFLDMFLDGIYNSGLGEKFYLYGFSIMLIGFFAPELKRLLNRIDKK
jgi:tetratricopeptide (TPR) repeat protein